MVKRIFVEKKKGFDVEAKGLFNDIKANLHPAGLTGVRVINRYDIQNLEDDIYAMVKYQVFAEPAVDMAYDEEMPNISRPGTFFAVEYLPGQYDQRADSAVQCIKLIRPDANPQVRCARIIVLEGELTEEDVSRIANYCVNPVDSQFVEIEKPDVLDMEMAVPEDVATVEGFNQMTQDELLAYKEAQEFAMSDNDILFIQEYFKRMKEEIRQ